MSEEQLKHELCGESPKPTQTAITKNDVGKFTFAQYRKVGTTKLSNEILPTGTKIETLEGEYTCHEPSRLAIDSSGNVYPIAESVKLKSYESA